MLHDVLSSCPSVIVKTFLLFFFLNVEDCFLFFLCSENRTQSICLLAAAGVFCMLNPRCFNLHTIRLTQRPTKACNLSDTAPNSDLRDRGKTFLDKESTIFFFFLWCIVRTMKC